MSSTIRDVVIRIGLQQVDNTLRAPDTSAVKGAIKGLRSEYLAVQQAQSQYHKAIHDAAEESKRDAVEQQERVKRLTEEYKRQQQTATESSIRAAEGFRTAGDGLFTMARGLVLLGASQEDIDQLVKKLALVQGGFDVFKGSVDVVKGVYEGTKALTVATTAYSAAQAGATATTVTYTTATTGATVATNGLTAAMSRNPYLLAAAAIAVVIGAVALWATTTEDAAEDVGKSLDDVNKKLAEQQALQERANQIRQHAGHAAARQDLIDTQERVAAMRDQLSIQQQIDALSARQAGGFGMGAADALRRTMETGISGVGLDVGSEGQLRAGIELNDLLDRQLATEQQKLELIKQQADARNEDLQNAQSILQSVTQQLAVEKAKSQAASESLGRLNPGQRAQLQRLSDKAGRGEDLSNRELERLERLGGSSVREFTSEQFRQRGEQFAGLLSPFQQQQQQREQSLQQQQSFFSQVVEDVSADAGELQEEYRQRARESADRIIALMEEKFIARSQLEELESRLAEGVTHQ